MEPGAGDKCMYYQLRWYNICLHIMPIRALLYIKVLVVLTVAVAMRSACIY
jgi:hypothetical protein